MRGWESQENSGAIIRAARIGDIFSPYFFLKLLNFVSRHGGVLPQFVTFRQPLKNRECLAFTYLGKKKIRKMWKKKIMHEKNTNQGNQEI